MAKGKRFTKWSYKKHKSLLDVFCLYCGELGDSKDHVPAISYADFYPKEEKLLVRACTLCNVMLSNRPFHTIQRRAEFLLLRYPARFKKVLESPNWSEKEIEELQGVLKRSIIKQMRKKSMAQRKIQYLRILVGEDL